jgi:NADH-quinone oxidoreductase subunit L
MIELSEPSGLLDFLWLLVAIPAASAVVLLLAGRRADRWGHLLGCASVGVAFLPLAVHHGR